MGRASVQGILNYQCRSMLKGAPSIKDTNKHISKASKFIATGIIANLINYGIFSLLAQMKILIFLSAALAYFAGLLFSFFLSRFWVFSPEIEPGLVRNTGSQISGFVSIHFLSAFLMGIFTHFLVNEMDLGIGLSFVISAVPVATLNYFVLNSVVFNTRYLK